MGDVSDRANADTQQRNLLALSVPNYRQAYSDRTAWLMAYLSELSYIRFNALLPSKLQRVGLETALNRLLGEASQSTISKIVQLVDRQLYDHHAERDKLELELNALNQAVLLSPFDSQTGTQAILVEMSFGYVLAFRGTEANRFNDIKTNALGVLTKCQTSGRVHTGFNAAYNAVEPKILAALAELSKPKPLFITGHSLGGALATIAAKRLHFKHGIAACYTFGAPRVGDAAWIADIKTPIYRLVNAIDAVTLLPPSSVTLGVFSRLIGLIPFVGETAKSFLLNRFQGYLHGGNMRYLTDCPTGDYSSVKLLYSVSLLFRLRASVISRLPYNKFLADHAISIYRKKLAIVAQQRNSHRVHQGQQGE